jgi:hypothetical protein
VSQRLLRGNLAFLGKENIAASFFKGPFTDDNVTTFH